MKKRFLTLVCALLVGALSIFSAAADVIVEPEDSFYASHREDCDYLGNRYYANGETGTLSGYRAPGSARVKQTFPNGELLYISFTYPDDAGMVWGVVEQEDGTCWVRLDEVVRKYDSELFRAEHADALVPFDELAFDYENLRGLDGEIVVWTYPGSGESSGTITEFKGGADSFGFSDCYTDENGLRWGYIGYYFGWRDCWICLDDPTNPSLPVKETLAAVQALHQPQPGASGVEVQPERGRELLLAGGLVAAVVGVTAILLAVFYRRKKTEDLH